MKEDKIPSSLEFDVSIIENLPKDSKILDLGCGSGVLCHELSKKGFNMYGIDCSEDGIRVAIDSDPNSNYSVMDASELSFESLFFDFIIIKALFTVVPELDIRNKIIGEASRVLKQDGHIYIADFAQTWHNLVYYNRYIEGYSETGEMGLFNVHDNNGCKLYTAKHFNQKEIVDMYLGANLCPIQFDTIKVKTRSGNIIDGYKMLLCKSLKPQ
jgi:ubiquinone/menaquinone biosynthesis C-methylase UbiE